MPRTENAVENKGGVTVTGDDAFETVWDFANSTSASAATTYRACGAGSRIHPTTLQCTPPPGCVVG